MQTHPDNEIELGYLISRTDLLDGNFNISDTGFAALGRKEKLDFLTFASDENSLGALFQKHTGETCKEKPCNPVPFETNNNNGFKMGKLIKIENIRKLKLYFPLIIMNGPYEKNF